MMYKILLSIALVVVAGTAAAHPVLPEPVMEYIWSNPKATDAQIDAWLSMYPEYDIDDTREMMTMLRDLTDDQLENLVANPAGSILSEPAAEAKKPSILRQLLTFIHQGILHIIGGPDHVLFVLALLLIPMAIGQLVKAITTFTIAHSITLLLAGLQLVSISSKIVEPIIALSIAYVALSAVYLPKTHWANSLHNRLAVIFGFGLFHGLGFASVFGDLPISASNFIVPLLGFNIGVEVGQLCIVGVALPILNEVRKLPQATILLKICATLMAAVAIFWFVDRIV